jgi:DNA polymerase-3 subunit delta
VSGRGRPAVVLVRGDDPSLVAQHARRVVSEALGDEPAGLVVEEHGPDDLDLGALLGALTTPPFLASRRIVVVRGAGGLPAEDARRLAEATRSMVPEALLVLVADGGTVPAPLVAAARDLGELVDASTPTGRARGEFVAARLREAPVRLDRAAAALLERHLGDDLARLPGLLGALAAAYGPGARIGEAELEPFLGSPGGVAPYELTDAISRGDTAGALAALARLLEAGDRHPLVVLAVLERHYEDLLRLDGAEVGTEEQAAAVLGTRSTFRAKKALAEARRLGFEALARAIVLLAEADLDLRGATGADQRLVLEVLVARLSRLGPPQRGRTAPPRVRAPGRPA